MLSNYYNHHSFLYRLHPFLMSRPHIILIVQYIMDASSQQVHNYSEAVNLLKEVKQSNDRINSYIGVQSGPQISNTIRIHSHSIPQTLDKIERFLTQNERQYIGPEGARRMATLRQQFRIQRDRRNMLLQSVKYEEKSFSDEKESETTQSSSKSHLKQGRQEEYLTPTGTADELSNSQNFGVVITEVDKMAINEEDLKEELISPKGQKGWKRGLQLARTNRKKVLYFLLFTLLKIAVWMLFFA